MHLLLLKTLSQNLTNYTLYYYLKRDSLHLTLLNLTAFLSFAISVVTASLPLLSSLDLFLCSFP